MTPYYEHAGITIYHGDCREIWTHHKADVLITDPPYGTKHYATDVVVLNAALLENWRTAYRSSAVFGWPEQLIATCVTAGIVPDEWVTWWPTNAAVRTSPVPALAREAEVIAIFGEVRGFNRLRQPRSASSRRMVDVGYDGAKSRGRNHGQPDTRYMGDVWTDASPGLGFQSHLRQHPNEKPVGVLSRLVEALTMPREIVLDVFMGSGTTLVAAKALGRSAIGIEIEERYCEIAAKRLEQEVFDFGGAA